MTEGLSFSQRIIKRAFDLLVAIVGLLLSFWMVSIAWLLASIDTRSNGFFVQKRVGRNGQIFSVVKIKTMRPIVGIGTTITAQNDPRITKLGVFFRRTKIDELPQLWNVLIGQMSFVGPRPDVPGYADRLKGEQKLLLSIRPGITGPATLKYKNEEELLAQQADPQKYNDEIIFPDKVRINLEYIRKYSFKNDLMYILKTIIG